MNPPSKRTGNSRMVSHTRHNNGPTLSRKDSPPGCLRLAMAYRYNFCMEETWWHVSVHWQHGNIPVMSELLYVLWPGLDRGPQSLNATPPPTFMPIVLTTWPWTLRQNGLALALGYHTPATTTSRHWAGTILHRTAYTRHWRIDIVLAWRKHIAWM